MAGRAYPAPAKTPRAARKTGTPKTTTAKAKGKGNAPFAPGGGRRTVPAGVTATAAKQGAMPAAGAKLTSQTAVYGAIAARAGMLPGEVRRCFEALHEIVGWELSRKGRGESLIPGLLKIKVVRKAATKAKQGINPFTKEPMTMKAKPARNLVKAVPLKALKDLAAR